MHYSELMAAFSDVILKRFRDLLRQVFQDAEEQLLRLAESHEDRFFISHAADVIRGLKLEEFRIQLHFCRELKSNFEAYLRHEARSPELQIQQSNREPCAHQRHSIETEIQAAPNAEASVDSRLQCLTERLYHFSPYAGLVGFRSELPIAPDPVVDAFCRAIESLSVPIHKKIMALLADLLRSKLKSHGEEIYAQFDLELMGLIQPLPPTIQDAKPLTWPSTVALATSLSSAKVALKQAGAVNRIRRMIGTWIHQMGDYVSPDRVVPAYRSDWQIETGPRSGKDSSSQWTLHFLRDDSKRSRWMAHTVLMALISLGFIAYRPQALAPLVPGWQVPGKDAGARLEDGLPFGNRDEPKVLMTQTSKEEMSAVVVKNIPAPAAGSDEAEMQGSPKRFADFGKLSDLKDPNSSVFAPMLVDQNLTSISDNSGLPGSQAWKLAEFLSSGRPPDLTALNGVSDYPPASAPESLNRQDLIKNLRIKRFDWLKTRPDNVVVMNVQIHNGNPVEASDLELVCISYTENLTDLGILQLRIPQSIPSGTVVELKDLHLGTAHRKTKRLLCKLS